MWSVSTHHTWVSTDPLAVFVSGVGDVWRCVHNTSEVITSVYDARSRVYDRLTRSVCENRRGATTRREWMGVTFQSKGRWRPFVKLYVVDMHHNHPVTYGHSHQKWPTWSTKASTQLLPWKRGAQQHILVTQGTTRGPPPIQHTHRKIKKISKKHTQ